MKQNTQISENTPIRAIQTIIDEAKAMGLRVVHRPEKPKSNVINIAEAAEQRRIQLCMSPEAA